MITGDKAKKEDYTPIIDLQESSTSLSDSDLL
jgi:hypothetical protein